MFSTLAHQSSSHTHSRGTHLYFFFFFILRDGGFAFCLPTRVFYREKMGGGGRERQVTVGSGWQPAVLCVTVNLSSHSHSLDLVFFEYNNHFHQVDDFFSDTVA